MPRFARRARGRRRAIALRKLILLPAGAAVLIAQGCTIQTLALRSVDGMFDNTVAALMREGDLQFAESAIAGDMKLLEGVVDSDPTNVKYLQLACMGYASYALAFAEDDPARALLFYTRAQAYGARGLELRGIPKGAFTADAATMRAALRKLQKSDVPLVFWTANAWGSAISLQPNEPDAIASIPTANALMEWVKEREPDYFFGGPFLYFGVYYGSYPPALGGRPDLAKENFDRAIASSSGRFLMTEVLYARTYAVETQNRELFQVLLTRVAEAPPDLLPEQRLANAVAQKRARQLLARAEELF
ncbi:MAG: TRAP transporter TatT component family protein [Spirochaetia bacterium]